MWNASALLLPSVSNQPSAFIIRHSDDDLREWGASADHNFEKNFK
uniref:Uncharacterized protein n=1 Tax=Setaria italica TaxID=4555 RepID=K4ANI2_SETIT